MANSLRNKIKHFCYKGELSESERDRLLNALDDADRINSELEASWIPCSEKNPNETGGYFTTIKWLDRENVYKYMVVKRDYFAEYDAWNDSLVIAWMPLPEPYKAESEEQ